MRLLHLILLCPVLFGATLMRAASGPGPAAPKSPLQEPVWQARLPDFSEASYEQHVESLMANFERVSGKKLVPGEKKKAGLKIYADSGPGMATPVALVKAVIGALKRRGFEHQNIFLVGLNALRLRMTG